MKNNNLSKIIIIFLTVIFFNKSLVSNITEAIPPDNDINIWYVENFDDLDFDLNLFLLGSLITLLISFSFFSMFTNGENGNNVSENNLILVEKYSKVSQLQDIYYKINFLICWLIFISFLLIMAYIDIIYLQQKAIDKDQNIEDNKKSIDLSK